MGKRAWNACAAIGAVFLAAAAVLCLVRGDCGGYIDCGNTMVPMKCHWAYLAAFGATALGTVMSVLGIFQRTKGARIMAAIAAILSAILSLIFLYGPIGVCSGAMACVDNRILVTIVSVVAIIALCVGIALSGRDGAAKPKAKL